MALQFPTLTEYEVAIKKNGTSALNLDGHYGFIASRTVPILFYSHGSGAFACVFKIQNFSNSKKYAMRCFLNGGSQDKIDRSIAILQKLSTLNAPWLCETKFFPAGISVKGESYPTALMEWTDGRKLNDFVSLIVQRNDALEQLQQKLLELNKSLENAGLAHGDIQSGNLFVEGSGSNINLKLVDYDAFYIPSLKGQKAVETGHSSFQHPKRTKTDYDSTIDRFSFLIIITALEALKFDKTLWDTNINIGYNDGDNILFKSTDFANPASSKLIQKLRSLGQPSLNFYLDKLLSNSFSARREEFSLFQKGSPVIEKKSTVVQPLQPTLPEKYFKITSSTRHAKVFTKEGKGKRSLGEVPIELDITFAGRMLILEYDGEEKNFYLNKDIREYKIELDTPALKPEYAVSSNTGQLLRVTVPEIEKMLRNGTKIDYIFHYGNFKKLDEIPDLKKLKDSLTIPKYDSHPKEPVSTVTNSASNEGQSTSPWVVFLIIVAFIGLLLWIINTSFGKFTETVDTDTSVNALSPMDSTATITSPATVDSSATVNTNVDAVPESVSYAAPSFSVFTTKNSNIDGCGSYFYLSKADMQNGEFLFTGDLGFEYVEIVIDSSVQKLTKDREVGNQVYLSNGEYSCVLSLTPTENGDEVQYYRGNIKIIKGEQVWENDMVGESGC